MALIGRIIVIIVAVMLASLAAGVTIAVGMLGPQWHGFTGDVGERAGFWLVVLFASSFTAAIALLPVLAFIVLAELSRLRSLLVYALAGAAMMLVGYYGTDVGNPVGESIDAPPPLVGHNAEIAIAAGVVFGLTYWLIAGRNAGRWRG